MSRGMKAVMWITGVATVIAGLSFVFIQATSVEIQQWSTDGPAAANNFATIGLTPPEPPISPDHFPVRCHQLVISRRQLDSHRHRPRS